ncbi:MAG: hypothetical protein QXE55_06865 [Saccharolobus sp.]
MSKDLEELVNFPSIFIIYFSPFTAAPPANSWIWSEAQYGIGGTAMLQALIDYWYVPLYKSTIVTTTLTTTVTTTTSSSILPIVAGIIVIIIIAVLLLMRRRR